jgi:hypothetical protein
LANTSLKTQASRSQPTSNPAITLRVQKSTPLTQIIAAANVVLPGNANEFGETTMNKAWRKHLLFIRKVNNLEEVHCVRDAMELKAGSELCHFAEDSVGPASGAAGGALTLIG